MRGIICIFFPCHWIWHFNAQEGIEPGHGNVGIYQCTRCKTISIGATR